MEYLGAKYQLYVDDELVILRFLLQSLNPT